MRFPHTVAAPGCGHHGAKDPTCCTPPRGLEPIRRRLAPERNEASTGFLGMRSSKNDEGVPGNNKQEVYSRSLRTVALGFLKSVSLPSLGFHRTSNPVPSLSLRALPLGAWGAAATRSHGPNGRGVWRRSARESSSRSFNSKPCGD